MYADEQARVQERSAARRTAGQYRIEMTQEEDTMFFERCQLVAEGRMAHCDHVGGSTPGALFNKKQ
jgi:hypothetical protein